MRQGSWELNAIVLSAALVYLLVRIAASIGLTMSERRLLMHLSQSLADQAAEIKRLTRKLEDVQRLLERALNQRSPAESAPPTSVATTPSAPSPAERSPRWDATSAAAGVSSTEAPTKRGSERPVTNTSLPMRSPEPKHSPTSSFIGQHSQNRPAPPQAPRPVSRPHPGISNSPAPGHLQPQDNVLASIVRLYNSDPEQLKTTHRPELLKAVNPSESHRSGVPLLFERGEDGDYLAVPSGQGIYYAVPKPRPLFQSDQAEFGGMAQAFNCLSYRRGYRYRKVQLIQPARLRMDDSGWTLVQRGELRLAEEERES